MYLKKKLKQFVQYDYLLIILTCFVVSWFLLFIFPWIFQTSDNKTNDLFFRLRYFFLKDTKVSPYIVHCVIDDNFLEENNISSFNREIYGDIISALSVYNPKLIACDILFQRTPEDPFFSAQNTKLIRSTEDAGNVLFPIVFRNKKSTVNNILPDNFIWFPSDANRGIPPLAGEMITPFRELLLSSGGVGYINLYPDPDGICRSSPLLYSYGNGFIPSYALLLACKYLSVDSRNIEINWGKYITLKDALFHRAIKKDIKIPVDKSGFVRVNYKGPWLESNFIINARILFNSLSDPDLKNRLYNSLSQSIVIISDISTRSRDYNTGIFESIYPSIGVIASVTDSILSEDYIRPFTFPESVVLSFVFIALLYIATCLFHPRIFLFVSLFIFLLFFICSVGLFLVFKVTPMVTSPAFALAISIVCIMIYKLFQTEKQRKQLLEEMVSNRTSELWEAHKKISESNAELKLAIREKQQALLLKETAIQQKSLFFHNLAHETKTPLTLVKNYLESYIKKTGASPELNIVSENINKLCSDVVNFFDREKIEKGEFVYNHNQHVNFSQLIKNTITLFKVTARKMNLSISQVIENNIFVKADPSACSRIINNLLDNALKYARDNSFIKVELASINNKAELRVFNEGSCIPEEQKSHIFEAYFQLSHNKKMNQGAGLGLPIIKGVIDQLHGTIDVESRINQGTTFIVTLQKTDIQKNTTTGNHYDYFPSPGEKIKPVIEDSFCNNEHTLLIVEDNYQLLSFLQKKFSQVYNVLCATNGKIALSKLTKKNKPDVIISDIVMDEMDGYTFYDTVSGSGDFKDIPFIFLTARTSFTEKMDGLSRGAIDFITKPFSYDELAAKINVLISMRKAQKDNDTIEFENKISRFLRKKPETNIKFLHDDYDLTKKETQVVKLLYTGLLYKEISDRLNISLPAVRKRVHSIYKKFNVGNKSELILKLEKQKNE